MDYASNARKNKDGLEKPEKKIERVVNTEIIIQKKSLGKKFKDLIVEADFRSVGHYVIADVLLPAIKNLVVDTTTQGIQRAIYGDSAIRRRNFGYNPGPRITYNAPVNRVYGYGGSPITVPSRTAPLPNQGPRSLRPERNEYIISSREEADLVLETMSDIIDNYQQVSVADFNELIGLPSTHVDNKWGWTYIGNAKVLQVREGYLIDLPPIEQIQI